jgi:hypothetical protein
VIAGSALPWVLRAAWVVLPFTAGPALGAALDHRSNPVRTTASVLLWGLWAAVLLSTLLPRPAGLTLLRTAAPAAVVAAAAAAPAAGTGPLEATLALVTTAVALTLAFLPEVGFLFVNGAAYGDERRHLLRAPGPLLSGPLYVAWALLVAAVVSGPMLLAARSWTAGALATAAGAPLAVLLARALHSLTQRWTVLVPAGLVLKDHLALGDPVLFRRQEVDRLGPAPAGADAEATDLTCRSPGLALELRLRQEVALTRVVPGVRGGEPAKVTRLLFTPTRPGALLRGLRMPLTGHDR